MINKKARLDISASIFKNLVESDPSADEIDELCSEALDAVGQATENIVNTSEDSGVDTLIKMATSMTTGMAGLADGLVEYAKFIGNNDVVLLVKDKEDTLVRYYELEEVEKMKVVRLRSLSHLTDIFIWTSTPKIAKYCKEIEDKLEKHDRYTIETEEVLLYSPNDKERKNVPIGKEVIHKFRPITDNYLELFLKDRGYDGKIIMLRNTIEGERIMYVIDKEYVWGANY